MDLSKCGGICHSNCRHYSIGKDCPTDATYTQPAFKRENRYLVLKRRDIHNSLTELEQQILREITTKVRLYREGAMQKPPLECVVVECDWPEYEPTWKAIEDRMRG